MSVLVPSDEVECRQLLTTAFRQDHPVAVRYPRGSGTGEIAHGPLTDLPFGKGQIRRTVARPVGQGGSRVAILAFGTLLYAGLAVAERIDACVANMRFVKPMDRELVLEQARTHDALVTLEDGCLMGGAGAAVLEVLAEAGVLVPVLNLGFPDTFIEHGDPARLMAMCGLDAAGIEQSILKRFGTRPALVRSAGTR
jgi:1-deoxy-D-xylulose-5-phosphate synthase